MKIISHRGFWLKSDQKNSIESFERAVVQGFGIETDIRDHEQRLVISHDPPRGSEVDLLDFMNLVSKMRAPLALNIKADGLASLLVNIMRSFTAVDWFVFDMSVPDMLLYAQQQIPFYTRLSEYESPPILLDEAKGVWVDSFNKNWVDISSLLDLSTKGKQVVIVSPELHKRDHLDFWHNLKAIADNPMISLCTDYPKEAESFFNETGT